MKKSLVALAALAATSAFAQFSIDGLMDVGYQTWNYKGNSTSGVGGNGSGTSQINFRGTEDLGGGMKATFRVETDWSLVSNKANQGFVNATDNVAGTAPTSAKVASATSSGGTFGNGEIRVGLTGAFGELHAGAVNFEQLNAYLTGQPFGTAIGGGFRGIYRNDSGAMNASAVRADQSLKYVTPNFNGLSGTLYNVSKAKIATGASTAAPAATYVAAFDFSTGFNAYDMAGIREVGIRYNQGPINVVYANQVTDAYDLDVLSTASNTKRTLNTLGANYTMGATTLYVMNQNYGTKTAAGVTATKTDTTTFGIKHVIGQHTFSALTGGYKFKESNSTNATTLAAVGKTSKLTGLGYDYALSKLTSAYVRYESINDEGRAFAGLFPTVDGSDNKRTRTAVGLRVGF